MKQYKDERTWKQQEKLDLMFTRNSTKCKCGHTMLIPPHLDYILCSWCKNYVFRTPKDEFIFRFKEKERQEKKKSVSLENI